jgi:NAD-dependent SIR2 family protein deacetylase
VLEVRALRIRVQKAKKLLHPFVVAFGEALDSVEQHKIEQEVRQALS